MSNDVVITIRTRQDLSGLRGMEKQFGDSGDKAAKNFSASFSKGLAAVAGGAGPGILGISAAKATVVSLGASALGAVPALTAVGAGIGVIGAGFALLEKTNKGFASSVAKTMTEIKGVFASAATPLIKPLEAALSELGTYIKVIGPEFREMFAAAAPLIAPLTAGLEYLVGGILPGLVAILHAAQPAFAAFANILHSLGGGIGGMLSAFAPVISQSSVLFTALGNVITGLLPVITSLTTTMAKTLGPVFTQFAGIVQDLLPVLKVVGGVLADFAKAVLTDLVGAFSAVGQLIKATAPSFTLLAKSLGQVFNALENAGTFAILGDALEAIVPVLAKFINQLAQQLAPFLPVLMAAIAKVANVMITLLATGLTTVLTGLTSLMKAVPALVPILASLAVVWKVLDVVMALNPFVALSLAILALVGGLTILWQKSALFRDIIKDIAVVMLNVGIVIVKANQGIVGAFLNMVGVVIDAAAKAFGWIPGIGPKLKTAAANFDGFKTGVNNSFNSILAQMEAWKAGLSGAASTAHDLTTKMTQDFDNQAKSAGKAKTDLDAYTNAIKDNGANSRAAQKDRQQLITDLTKAGVNATIAQRDVGQYTKAVQENGIDSKAAQNAREKLVSDILAASNNAKQGKTDLTNYTNAVKDNGVKSDAAKSARQKLITDLTNAGLDSKTAKQLVDNLSAAIKAIPSKKANVSVFASGGGGMTFTQKVASSISSGGFSLHSLAAGGMISSGTGPKADDVPAMLSKGELVVPAHMVKGGAVDHLRGRLPGFAAGGIAGMEPWVQNAETGFVQSVESSFLRAEMANLKAVVAAHAKAAAATAAAGSKVPNVGSGVARWKGLVDQALRMEGLSTAFDSRVLYQMQTESGGNPNAINLTDSNAARGTPSKGLMQVIGPTFAAYHWPGTSNNIYDPLANIAAAINYAKHTYGPQLGNQYGGIGSGHGYAAGGMVKSGWYDSGGWLPTGASIAVNNTGRPERVLGPGQGGGAVTLEVSSGGQGVFEQFMSGWIKQYVRVKGGGDVQRAFGR